MTATFLDAAGKTLLEQIVNGPTQAETDNTVMLPRAGSGFVLPNTRSVQLFVDLTSKSVTFNSAEIDNIIFSVSLLPVLGTNLVVNGDGETLIDSPTMAHGWNSADDFFTTKWTAAGMAVKDPAQMTAVFTSSPERAASLSPRPWRFTRTST